MEDCFFYTTKKGDDTFVVPLCIECNDKHPNLNSWFWPGSEQGYGPFRFACEKCGHVIYQEEYDEDSETEETETTP